MTSSHAAQPVEIDLSQPFLHREAVVIDVKTAVQPPSRALKHCGLRQMPRRVTVLFQGLCRVGTPSRSRPTTSWTLWYIG